MHISLDKHLKLCVCAYFSWQTFIFPQEHEKDLRSDMFRDSEKKYRQKLVELKTTEMANDDLKKYYEALDKYVWL